MDHQMKNDIVTQTPNEALAAQIFQKLLDEGLVVPDDKADFIKKIARGEARDSDWSVALTRALQTNSSTDETSKT